MEKYNGINITPFMRSELNKGWINIDKLYKLIKNEYLNNDGKHKNIGEFLPRVLNYLSEIKNSQAEENETVYGLTVNKDTKYYIYGSREGTSKLGSQIIYGTVVKNASVNYFEESLLENSNNVILISAEYKYSSLPAAIKNAISQDDYNALGEGQYKAFKLGNAQIAIVK